jgi:hypothetical protein
MRALLTTLGIVIGVAAVIAMMEIGKGSSSAVKKSIASMGANTILVLPGTAASGGVSFGGGSVMNLTPQDYEAVVRECPSIRSAAPVVRARTQVVYGNRNWVPSSAERQQGLYSGPNPGPGAVSGGISGRPGNPHQERHVSGGRGADGQRGQHDGFGPG